MLIFLLFLTTVSSSTPREVCLRLTPSPKLQKFVDELPVIPKIKLGSYYTLRLGAYKIKQKLHRDLPETTLYGFGTSRETAMYPGPTLVASKGETAYVRWENYIPDREHFLPFDYTIEAANPRYGYVPVSVHLHGLEVASWSDGNPQGWFTSLGETGPNYVTQNYVYANNQRRTLLWYHDHSYGYTRLNVAGGLVGLYDILSQEEDPQWIPSEYSLLVIQDKQFFRDGSINYPNVGINPAIHPQWCIDYFGDTILVNGKVWPYVEVYNSVQRFRLVNAANSRFFVFNLNHSRLSFVKIGTDGGYLQTPISQVQLRVAPSERVDFLIDFSRARCPQGILLFNNAPAPYPSGNVTFQEVMLFKVKCQERHSNNSSPAPTPLTPDDLKKMTTLDIIQSTTGLDLSSVDWEFTYNRPFIFSAAVDSGNNVTALFLNDRMNFLRPVTEQVILYTNEVWCFINTMTVAHPIHIHLVNFFFLERQPFDGNRFRNNDCSFRYEYSDRRSCYTGDPIKPGVDEVGWKDTAVVQPMQVTRFFMRFRPNEAARFPADPTTFPHFVWHCHLLEHEDNEMMRPLVFSAAEAIYTNTTFPRYNPY